MLIPEAVQLVLHAASLGESGQTYVLEMGRQIRILDMARNVARLAGYVPEVEMPIVITGSRPGEKLYEELVSHDEVALPSSIQSIMRVETIGQCDDKTLIDAVAELEKFARDSNDAAVLAKICQLVPTAQLKAQQHPPPSEDRLGAPSNALAFQDQSNSRLERDPRLWRPFQPA